MGQPPAAQRLQGADAERVRRAAHRASSRRCAPRFNHILWVDVYYIDALERDPTVLKRYDDPPPDFADAAALIRLPRRAATGA